MNSKIKRYSYFDENGAVLITALLILALLTIIGVGSVLMTNTDVKISGNLKASSLSLYVAEGGIEVAKTSINSSSANNFSLSPGTTNATMTGFYYTSVCKDTGSAYPCRTISHPLNWFPSDWFEYDSGSSSCTSTALTTTSDWPVCKDVTVGDQTARVIVQRPSWSPAAPTKIAFKSITSQHMLLSVPKKKISVTFEIDFGNNLLTFQEFRESRNPVPPDPNKEPEKFGIDNINDYAYAILSSKSGYDWAMGGDPGSTYDNTDRITGIYTGNRKIRIDVCAGAAGCVWSSLGIAEKNSSNNTFILSNGSGIQCFYSTSGYTKIGGAGGLTLEGNQFKAVEIDPALTCT